MKPIHDVDNMQPEAIELFEAAGYMDAQTIFDHKISDITTELIKANNVLGIIDTEPNRAMTLRWIQPLKVKFGGISDVDVPQIIPEDLINASEIMNTPLAVPVTDEFINKHHIDLLELPCGKVRFLEVKQAIAFHKEQEVNSVNYKVVSGKAPSLENHEAKNKQIELLDKAPTSGNDSQLLDKSRILKMDAFKSDGSDEPTEAHNESINLTKTTRKETNLGVNPQSKFYVKGVLHKNVSTFKSGCRWFIVVNLLIILSFATTSLVFVNKEIYSWAVGAPLLGILAIIIYFTAAQRSSCPVCNQKQFALKICLKHRKAHHWLIFGYMLPTAIHALLFKWFRCIFCGTPIRLKE